MSKIHLYCRRESLRKKLKENSGLGTEATRTSIIDGLVKRKLLTSKGKQLVSTDFGRKLVDSVPHLLRDPETTALWEDTLERVARGESSEQEFLRMQEQVVTQLTSQVATEQELAFAPGDRSGQAGKSGKSAGGKKQGGKKSGSQAGSGSGAGGSSKDARKCPVCGEKSLKRLKNKQGGYYWGCFNKESHPEEKPVFRPDNDGKPGSGGNGSSGAGAGDSGDKPAKCPECGEMSLYRRKSKKGSWYWGCFNKDKHSDGGPVFRPDKAGGQK